jgi:ubiquinone/menaquinone biosynthesis C-methylase UbiE
MAAHDNQPDWNLIAEKFDLWVPHLLPVGEALLDALDARPGQHVLDVASGTGEPALTLARRSKGHLHIVGTDAAEGMVNAANAKVKKEKLAQIEFRNMAAEALTFADRSFDRVLCRFGVMLFNDPLQGLKEMRRVLKPDGRFALAVWSTPQTMTTLQWSYEVFKNRVSEDNYPPLAKVTSLGGPGVLEGQLRTAGFRAFEIEEREFQYAFPSFDAYWDVVEASDILKQQYDALPAGERDKIRDEVALMAREFHGDSGLRIPHRFLLAFGSGA